MPSSNRQHWNPERYAANARFVSDLGLPVVELLAPRPGERILDLGCGDGALSVALIERGCEVLGVDSSPEMVAAARRRGVRAEVMDGQSLRFDERFDAVFSNAALHWMTRPALVLDGVWGALRPGGRFAGEFGGQGNVRTIVAAIEAALSARGLAVASPWFFPDEAQFRELLEASRFTVTSLALFARPTRLPGDVRGWLETFAQPYTCTLPAADRASFVAELVETLRPALCDAQGLWTADYVRLRFSATKSCGTRSDP